MPKTNTPASQPGAFCEARVAGAGDLPRVGRGHVRVLAPRGHELPPANLSHAIDHPLASGRHLSRCDVRMWPLGLSRRPLWGLTYLSGRGILGRRIRAVEEPGRRPLLGEKDRVTRGFGELVDTGSDVDRVADQGELELAPPPMVPAITTPVLIPMPMRSSPPNRSATKR